MPFPLESKEQIYSDICARGAAEKFIIVPEFKLHYQAEGKIKRGKWADIAWLTTFDNSQNENGFPRYQVIAVFEIDGFNVPLPTIELYSIVYPMIRKSCHSEFPCYVPLYSRATHRSAYGLDQNIVNREFKLRHERAATHGNEVTVCDGAQRSWLDTAVQCAKMLVQSGLSSADREIK